MKLLYGSIVLLLFALSAGPIFADTAQSKGSWKYYIERTTTQVDKLLNKTDKHVDRAFVHYGAGAKEAGGQIKTVPQVVYIDANQITLAEAAYYESPIVPASPDKFTFIDKLPDGIGSEPNLPAPSQALPSAFNILPIRPEEKIHKGLAWTVVWYFSVGMGGGPAFPGVISQEVIGYEQKMGRRCALIKYTIAGELKMDEHPELFTEQELREYKAEFILKGTGTVYFDPAEEIIVEKEQTISWKMFSQQLARLDDNSIGFATQKDEEKIVTIRVSLQPEENEVVENGDTEQDTVVPSTPADESSSRIVWVFVAIAIAVGGFLIWKTKATR